MAGDYQSIDIREYQHIIIDAFSENSTPKSFFETSTKMSALAKNWLTQTSVNRSIVFLLGFGLGMGLDDVTGFLIKALRERDFNFKDPLEVIYWYCFKNGYKFPKMLTLKQKYEEMEAVAADDAIYDDMTIGVRNTVKGITDDETLLHYLARFKSGNRNGSFSVTAWKWFADLYYKCQCVIADYYNADELEDLELNRDNQKERKEWTAQDITGSDIEKIFCSSTPLNKSGNLEKLSASKLAKYFNNKRFSRQHIAELLSKNVAVDRFDLITLNFFLFSQNKDYADSNKRRYIAFADSTNIILGECMMGELYVANPYECFLLMCILSDSPLSTYIDVWELSYEE